MAGTTPEPSPVADFVTNDIEPAGSAIIFIFGRISIIAESKY